MAMRYKLGEQEKETSKVNASEQTQSKDAKGFTIMIKKKTLLICAVSALVLLTGICLFFNQTRKIEGTWIRVADDNDLVGMIVKVENSQGVIVKTSPNTSLGYGFAEGQVKWKNIQKAGWGKYTFSDLVSDDDSLATYYDGSTSRMEVSLNGKKLILTVVAGELSGRTGWYQEWKKSEEK